MGSNEELSVTDRPSTRAAGLADRPPTRTHPGGDRRRGIRGGVGNDAVKTICDSGETNPVVFSHGEAILYWVLMNVKNPNLALADSPLPNTAHVVVSGNPTDGWTLANWNGAGVPA